MFLTPMILEACRSLKASVKKRAHIRPMQGPSMQEYYQSLDQMYQAGFKAGQLNKDIHEARAQIAKHVGE